MKRIHNRSVIFPKIATIAGGAILGSLIFATTAFAAGAPLIMEVQPVPADDPDTLLIYGVNFSSNDQFTFGTWPAFLDTSVDQGACALAPPSPLDVSDPDYACVVAALPDTEILPGDYLIEVVVESVNEQCVSKPNSMTFNYTPSVCLDQNDQESNTCEGGVPGDPTNLIAGGANNAVWALSTYSVATGGDVTFTAGVNEKGQIKWPNTLTLTMDGGIPQTISLHTSCSEPLVLGDIYGSMTLVAMVTEEALGPTTQDDEYDLTIGAVGPEGPQGVQGKLGDTGAQGVQGKLGDTGAQGVQGKLGDTGAQGVQGKLGDTGAQGVQGKLGDTGPQGVQGKLGDTGPQGV
ncbi:MAG: collagen-like protein, partial [Proteobacteria bacterium]|nr:collagen-like protein [Pseudomonadota bacterium]